ncbi:hypothetical protein ABW20_dc0106967 [Dactylellina cionopaga]|nr:hypothetical protein ABW20_dc0106967 [Dactylellina cionopaga]
MNSELHPPSPLDSMPSLASYALEFMIQSIRRVIVDFRERVTMYIPQKMTLEAPIDAKASSVGLDAAGLVALADIATIQERTVLTGTSSFLDIFVLAPGLHLQQKATGLNAGEHPACGALTTGYVFRVENPATVFYLQRIGRTGHLTTITVSKSFQDATWHTRLILTLLPLQNMNFLSGIAYFIAVSWGIAAFLLLILAGDWWGVTVFGSLMIARLINVIVIRRRSRLEWCGAAEPGVMGDLLILLSQDRWVRMKGLVDDLKAVTSGQWLRDEDTLESWFSAFATLIVYLAAALASNITQLGKILLLCLLVGSAGLLALANTATDDFQMHGCVVKVAGECKKYERRLHLANELIKETGRDDWAIKMGMIVKNKPTTETEREGEVIM